MNKKIKFLLVLLILGGVVTVVAVRSRPKPDSGEIIQEITPVSGSIQNTFSTTGTVLPKNRLQIKPPVNGRIEKILVKEGEKVKVGQMLAMMSSTERAALLDAARGDGEEKLKYWQEVYKPIELLAPIEGEVIVATTQPGQTVTTNDAVVVLSDQLIFRAQVDETDIGKVKLQQRATVSLDAYPDTNINAVVEHIYYESETINNVTIYKVDLIPQGNASILRSGMNTTINFIENSKDDALLIPLEAVHKEKEETFVLVKGNGDKEPIRRIVKLGISDDKNVEILSGVTKNDRVILKTKKYALPKVKTDSNPFFPARVKK